MGHGFHSYVSHNQRVNGTDRCHFLHGKSVEFLGSSDPATIFGALAVRPQPWPIVMVYRWFVEES
jgi:hypothetical protein